MNRKGIGSIGLRAAVATVLFAGAAAAQQTDAISRSVTIRVTSPPSGDAVSRSVTVNVGSGDLKPDATSRSVTLFVPFVDLQPLPLTVPQQGLAGSPFMATWTVLNDGTAEGQGTWFDRLYWSTDATIGNGDDVLALSEPITYAGGMDLFHPTMTYTKNVSATLPSTPGSYRLVLITDATNAVPEATEEGDNAVISTGTVQVIGLPKPDLAVTVLQSPSNGVLSGTTTSITYRVTNLSAQGATQVPSWFDSLFVKTSPGGLGPDLGAEFLAGIQPNVLYLPPGASYDVQASLKLPHDQFGDRYAAVYVDSRKSTGAWTVGSVFDVAETNENNNVAFGAKFTVALEPQPDLFVTSVAGPLTQIANGTIAHVTWNVVNQQPGETDANSSGSSSAWIDRLQLEWAGGGTPPNPSLVVCGDYVRSGPPLTLGQGYARAADILIPPTLAAGNWRFRAITDYSSSGDGAVTEFGFEGNNNATASAPFAVVSGQLPNLKPMSVTANGTPLLGHPLAVSWSVTETVGLNWPYSASWYDSLYLSKDQVLDASDPLLGSWSQSASPGGSTWSGANYQRSVSVTLPTSLAPASYYVLAAVDDGKALAESNELDNKLTTAAALSIGDAPANLVVAVNFDSSHMQPSAGAAGQTLALSWKVTNASANPPSSATWIDRAYFSNTSDLSGAAWEIGSATHSGGLAAGGSYVATVTAHVPNVFPGDGYFLVVRTDADGAVYESGGEAGNVAASTFSVTGDGPDLSLASVSTAPVVVGGQPVADQLQVDWQVQNLGNATTSGSPWTDSIALVGPSGSTALGSKLHVGAVASGGQYSNSAIVAVPPGTMGAFDVRVTADAGGGTGVAFETNESNNAKSAPVVLNVPATQYADLVVTLVDAPATVDANKVLSVTWTLKNQGSGVTSSAAWFDSVYLSSDEILTVGSDLLVGTWQHAAALAAGQQQSFSASFQVPLGISGKFFVYVVADSSGAVGEGPFEGNNVGHDPQLVDVALGNPADLVALNVSAPAAMIRGQTAQFAWTDRNASAQNPVVAAWDDAVYLSKDAVWDESDALVAHDPSGVSTLLPNGSLLKAPTFVVPAIDPGAYFVIVKVDAYNTVLETSEANDGISAGTVQVMATPLPLAGAAAVGLAPGENAILELDLTGAAPGSSVRIDLTHASPTAWTELYVRKGSVPSAGAFDFRSEAPTAAEQTVVIPNSEPALYYVLARTTFDSSPAAPTGATVSAALIPEGIAAVVPSHAGRDVVTLELMGAGLHKITSVTLVQTSSATSIPAIDQRAIDGTQRLVEFDLAAAPPGPYDVVAIAGSQTFTLAGAVEVEESTPLAAKVTLATSPSIRKGSDGVGLLRVENASNVNLPLVLVALGIEDDADVVIGSSTLELADLVAHSGGRYALYEVMNLGPGQVAEAGLSIAIGAEYGTASNEFTLPIGIASRVLDRDGAIGGYVHDLSEAMRAAAHDSPQSTAQLVQLASHGTAWWQLFLAAQGFAGNGSPLANPPSGSLARALTAIYDETASSPSAGLAIKVADTVALFACATDAALCGAPVQAFLHEALGGALRAEAPATAMGIAIAAGIAAQTCAEESAETGGYVFASSGPDSKHLCLPTPISDDPNDKKRPVGVGPTAMVAGTKPLEYRIYFENVAEALAPASEVFITDPFESTFAPSTFRLLDIRFGDVVVPLPPNTMNWTGSIDLTQSHGVVVLVSAGLDAANAQAYWQFKSIDPKTGEAPKDGKTGFLPPNKSNGEGQGSVSFAIKVRPDEPTGSSAENGCEVKFDANPPIATKHVSNAIDAAPPSSVVSAAVALPGTAQAQVAFGAGDDGGGSGVSTIVLYASKDGGAYAPVVETDQTSFLFEGEPDSTYRFYSVAKDFAGNEEPPPAVPDQAIVFGDDCDGNLIADSVEIANGTASDCDHDGTPDACQPDFDHDGVPDVCQALSADIQQIHLWQGGTQQLMLHAGRQHAGERYLLLGTFSGTSPGMSIYGSTMPLNFDSYTAFVLANPNSGVLARSKGLLDSFGRAQSTVVVPGNLASLVSFTMHHAYVLVGPPPAFVSNAVALKLLP